MGKLSKLIDKLEIGSGPSDVPASDEAVSEHITEKQLYQARFNFGVNFGGVFVREKWIYHSTFPEGTNTELEAVTKSARDNREDARAVLELHWTDYALDEDWDWLQLHGVNSVRVPLGYWNIDRGNYTSGTSFSHYKDVYANSWRIFKSHYIEPAAKRGISILVDIHGLPGGANKDDHSGEKGSKSTFWDSRSHQKLMAKALNFVAKDLKQYYNISGIQIVNEAEFSDSARLQKSYYTSAIAAIRQADKSVPIVISDGWWPNQWVEWVQQHQAEGKSAGIVVDTHCYRCFSDDDKKKKPDQIIQDLHGDLLTNLTDNGKGVDFMVGEWSSVLDGKTWENCGVDPADGSNSKRRALCEKFCCEQAKLIEERASAGSYFWTYKFEAGDGGEWDFRQQVGRVISAPRVIVPEEAVFDEVRDREYGAHCMYWNNEHRKEKYEHERFKEGFTTAWKDSLVFAQAGALMGRREAVKAARLLQHLQKKGKLPFVWEWELGYDKGLKQFRSTIQSSADD